MASPGELVLVKPLTLDGDLGIDCKAPNLLQKILSLLRNVRPGADLTHFQVPPTFNIPKSQLQCLGESIYCTSKELLRECNNPKSSLDRFLAVVAWSISTRGPCRFGVAPYNPILGETHHVSRGSLNVLLEQVSHHPPVTCFHATDEEEHIDITWCQHPVAKFYGTKVEIEVHGNRQLKLLNYGETYVMNSPKLLLKFIPPEADWSGNVSICCHETGLEAELCHTTSSFLSRRGNHSIKGKIYDRSSLRTLYEIYGHWGSTITVKDINNGKEMILYNANEAMRGVKTPEIKDFQGLRQSESVVVWSKVSRSILSRNWDEAREAKKAVEVKQRELAKGRATTRETWVPKHFHVSYSKENGWNGSPIENVVPPAPIIVPL